jgi:hypothetical protein
VLGAASWRSQPRLALPVFTARPCTLRSNSKHTRKRLTKHSAARCSHSHCCLRCALAAAGPCPPPQRAPTRDQHLLLVRRPGDAVDVLGAVRIRDVQHGRRAAPQVPQQQRGVVAWGGEAGAGGSGLGAVQGTCSQGSPTDMQHWFLMAPCPVRTASMVIKVGPSKTCT